MTAYQPRTPWSKAMRDLLADGAWHPFDQVVAAGARAVPPGVAARELERHRINSTVSGAARTRPAIDPINSGARRKAANTLASMVRAGTVERRDNQVRLRLPDPPP